MERRALTIHPPLYNNTHKAYFAKYTKNMKLKVGCTVHREITICTPSAYKSQYAHHPPRNHNIHTICREITICTPSAAKSQSAHRPP